MFCNREGGCREDRVGCPLLVQDTEQGSRVFSANYVTTHHLHPTLSVIYLIQVGSRGYVDNITLLPLYRKGLQIAEPESLPKRTGRFHLRVGTCLFLQPRKNTLQHCSGFQGLVSNWFIMELTNCLSYLKYMKGKFKENYSSR